MIQNDFTGESGSFWLLENQLGDDALLEQRKKLGAAVLSGPMRSGGPTRST